MIVAKLTACILAGVVVALSPSAYAGPFSGYQGGWSGAGTISTTGGAERLRCRAAYAVDGSGVSLRQNLTCASDSYKFEVLSDVIAEDGRLSGSWSETTRNASGTLSGSVSDGRFRATVVGPGFTAAIAVDSGTTHQNVTIAPHGTDVRRVSIVLQKNG